MHLHVTHITRYRFEEPLSRVTQSHRLTPASFDGQTVQTWLIEAEGGTRGACFRDGAGDEIQTLAFKGPVSSIDVVVTGEVITTDTSGVLRGHAETANPLTYLRETPLTLPDENIRKLAEAALDAVPESDLLARAHALATAVAKAITYAPGETEAHTTGAEALKQGKGVCQDHAHVLISAARLFDLPARYVSGYLFAGEEDGPVEASHGWAEIFVAGLGWVGFDAANACCPDDRYIRLGSGLEASDAAPIRGIVGGQSCEGLEVSVMIRPAKPMQQGQQQ